MMKTDGFPKARTAALMLGLVAALAACGVDGEPEQPTQATFAPVDLVTAQTPR